MNKGKYNALDIANYVINYSNDNKYKISNLKLQKILYFIQAAFLKFKNAPCFEDEIQAWDLGPVIPVVYHHFKQYGSRNIPKISSCDDTQASIYDFEINCYNENYITPDDGDLIRGMVDVCSEFSASRLVEITHAQEPWKYAYNNLGKNSVISKKSIKSFFERKN